MKRTIAALALAIAITAPAAASEVTCNEIGAIYKTIVAAKQNHASKAALSAIAQKADVYHVGTLVAVIEEVYSDSKWDKVNPDIAQTAATITCYSHQR